MDVSSHLAAPPTPQMPQRSLANIINASPCRRSWTALRLDTPGPRNAAWFRGPAGGLANPGNRCRPRTPARLHARSGRQICLLEQILRVGGVPWWAWGRPQLAPSSDSARRRQHIHRAHTNPRGTAPQARKGAGEETPRPSSEKPRASSFPTSNPLPNIHCPRRFCPLHCLRIVLSLAAAGRCAGGGRDAVPGEWCDMRGCLHSAFRWGTSLFASVSCAAAHRPGCTQGCSCALFCGSPLPPGPPSPARLSPLPATDHPLLALAADPVAFVQQGGGE